MGADGRSGVSIGFPGASTCALAAEGSPTKNIDGARSTAISRKQRELRRVMRGVRLRVQRRFGQGTTGPHTQLRRVRLPVERIIAGRGIGDGADGEGNSTSVRSNARDSARQRFSAAIS